MFFLHLRNELWKLFGKKRTYIGFGAFIIAQAAMLLIFQSTRWQRRFEQLLQGNGYAAAEFISALTVAVVMLMPQIVLLMPLYTTLTGGDMVAKEYEDGTLRMILSRPVSRFRLLLVKWLTGVIFCVLLVLALGVIALGFARMCFPWGGMFVFNPGQTFSALPADEGFLRYCFAHLFLAINASTTLSLAFMLSCFNMKPAAATIVALSALIASVVMEAIPAFDAYENWLITHHFRRWLAAFQNPIPWSDICQSEIILLAITGTAFLIGYTAFQLRDFKS